jgi:hypothetical protein
LELHAGLTAAVTAREADRAKELLEGLRGLAPGGLSGHLDYLSAQLDAMIAEAGAATDGIGTSARPAG